MSEAAEEWRPIPDYEGFYEASDWGNIRSAIGRGHGSRKGRVLRPGLTSGPTPRLSVALYKDGKGRTRLVHHLVLEAFKGKRKPGQEALHGPGGPLDNRLVNLRWENELDKVRDGTSNRGERNRGAKLTEAQVTEMRIRYAAGETQQILAGTYRISVGAVSQIVTGVRWAWLPGAVPAGTGRSRHGRRGAEHHMAKLTWEIVMECRERYEAGEHTRPLAREFGVSQASMQKAIAGKTWRQV
jgi:NUMOD4 motif-containing protein